MSTRVISSMLFSANVHFIHQYILYYSSVQRFSLVGCASLIGKWSLHCLAARARCSSLLKMFVMSGSAASRLLYACGCRLRQFSPSGVLSLPPAELEGPLPPKKLLNAFAAYVTEGYKDSKRDYLPLSTLAREWRETSPRQKARYEKDSRRRYEEFYRQMKEFSQSFASKGDQRLYLLSIKGKGNSTAYSMMKKDRASKLPREECSDYMLHKAKEDYKNLTSSELQAYQQMADNVNKENNTLRKPCKVSAYNAMLKERAATLGVDEGDNCKTKKAVIEYQNLTASEVKAHEELGGIMRENNI